MNMAEFSCGEAVRLLQRRGVPWYRKPLNMGVEHMDLPKTQILNYTLHVVTTAAVVINMFNYHRFIELDEPHGYTRSNFFISWEKQALLDPLIQNCDPALGNLTFCSPKHCNPNWLKWYAEYGCPKDVRFGPSCKTATRCDSYLDAQMNVLDVSSGVAFIPTRVKEETWERECSSNMTEDICRLQRWRRVDSTSRFVAGIENATLSLEHSFVASRFKEDEPLNEDWSQTSFDMPGELLRVEKSGDKNVLRTFKMAKDLLDNATEKEVKSVKYDSLSLSDILEAVHLTTLNDPSDTPDAAGASYRYDGMVIIVGIFYDNVRGSVIPPARPARYEYTFTRLPGLEFKAYRLIWADFPRKMIVEHRSGMYLRLVQTGRIARFSMLAMLTYLAAMIPIIRASRLICDIIAAYVLLSSQSDGYARFPPGERRARLEEDFFRGKKQGTYEEPFIANISEFEKSKRELFIPTAAHAQVPSQEPLNATEPVAKAAEVEDIHAQLRDLRSQISELQSRSPQIDVSPSPAGDPLLTFGEQHSELRQVRETYSGLFMSSPSGDRRTSYSTTRSPRAVPTRTMQQRPSRILRAGNANVYQDTGRALSPSSPGSPAQLTPHNSLTQRSQSRVSIGRGVRNPPVDPLSFSAQSSRGPPVKPTVV
eukprot:Hpha_TRINITY_DN26430_c0_g1::TRINITY_DN26430_c0_g1_i1::g.33896::m.33896